MRPVIRCFVSACTGLCRNVSAHLLLHHDSCSVLATFYIIMAVFSAPILRELDLMYSIEQKRLYHLPRDKVYFNFPRHFLKPTCHCCASQVRTYLIRLTCTMPVHVYCQRSHFPLMMLLNRTPSTH